MEPNPYRPPTTPSRSDAPETARKVVRRGIPLAIAIAWNVPLLAMFVAAATGSIGVRTMERLMAAWSLTIPICSMAIMLIPFLQRVVFVPEMDMKKMRPRLCGLAALWLAIFAVWLLTDLARPG